MDIQSGDKQAEARKYMTGLIEEHFPSGILPDPYKGKDIHAISGRELEALYKDIFHVETDQWIFEPEAPSADKLFQIVPFDEETGNQPPAPEEFSSMREAEEFLDKTGERWDKWKSVQIVDKQTGQVVDVW